MALVWPQTARAPRIVVSRGGFFFLLRTLLRRALHRSVKRGASARLQGAFGRDSPAAPGKRWFLVGLSFVQLPPAIRHGVRIDDAGTVQGCALSDLHRLARLKLAARTTPPHAHPGRAHKSVGRRRGDAGAAESPRPTLESVFPRE